MALALQHRQFKACHYRQQNRLFVMLVRPFGFIDDGNPLAAYVFGSFE